MGIGNVFDKYKDKNKTSKMHHKFLYTLLNLTEKNVYHFNSLYCIPSRL